MVKEQKVTRKKEDKGLEWRDYFLDRVGGKRLKDFPFIEQRLKIPFAAEIKKK